MSLLLVPDVASGNLLVVAAQCCTWDLFFYKKMVNWVKYPVEGKRELIPGFPNFNSPNIFQVLFDIYLKNIYFLFLFLKNLEIFETSQLSVGHFFSVGHCVVT